MVGFVASLLSGCLSAPEQTTVASALPAPPKAGHASVNIGRPFGFNTSVFALPIEVDGKRLMSLPPGQYTTVDLPPGPHNVSSPDEYWTRVISGTPHPAQFTVEAGKSYYLLPKSWSEDGGYRYTMVGASVVPEKTGINHSTFSVQVTGANDAPPAEFRQLSFAKPQ
ncbi:hypothetical protein ACFQZO_01755 [Bradyrhizobium sp. GCM10027634]|uniref:hypothetical protein n=1 Tax=unclassified Bradyrhizobium TaxID=2631580 RepID=UPI00188CECC6|nr:MULTISPECIES: hypothetical protein [unclassified Bradyrhizobium]MDN4999608.1 hypothetical protein [Bradyrhizobium sp. WYCCWR 12677]QOZ43475.1 hypothetical protein XH89_08285 [Bradyrhizobium sp. CCBAU 53340]